MEPILMINLLPQISFSNFYTLFCKISDLFINQCELPAKVRAWQYFCGNRLGSSSIKKYFLQTDPEVIDLLNS